jgi:hypothetical protein
MTPTARLLRQQASLCRRAWDSTRDVNEAYLMVHRVMAGALSGGFDPELDLGPSLARVLDVRARRLNTIEVTT